MILFIRFRIQFFLIWYKLYHKISYKDLLKSLYLFFYSPGYFLPGTFGGEKASAVPRRPARDAKIFISELFCSSQILQKLTHVQKSYRSWRLLPKMEEIESFIVFKQAKSQPPALESQNMSDGHDCAKTERGRPRAKLPEELSIIRYMVKGFSLRHH